MKSSRFLVLLCAFFILGCNDVTQEKDNDKVSGADALSPDTARELTSEEFSEAKKICNALAEKNTNINNLLTTKNFTFKRAKKLCYQSEEAISDFVVKLRRPVNYGRPSFEVGDRNNRNTRDFIYDIFTDENSLIIDLCDDVFANQKPKNIIKNSRNYIKYRIPGKNKLEIFVYRQSDGKWWPSRFEAFTFITTLGDDKEGMAYERYQGAYCKLGSNEVSYLYQVMQ